MNEERGEWIEFSSGAFRYCSNREEVKFSMKDLLSERWLSEKDFIITHRTKVLDAIGPFVSQIVELTACQTPKAEIEKIIAENFISSLRIDKQNEYSILKKIGILPNGDEVGGL